MSGTQLAKVLLETLHMKLELAEDYKLSTLDHFHINYV